MKTRSSNTPEITVQATEATDRVADARLKMRAAQRLLKAHAAKDSLIEFTEFTMPDIEDPDDAEKSRYSAQYFHRALAAALEEVEKGNLLRLIVTFPPRHGKSELTSRRFPAWCWGRDPYRHIIFGTYNQTFAEDYGRDVRGIVQTSAFQTTFPGVTLAKGSAAADRLKTEQGGQMVFVGRGGSATGRGGDILIIDDPLKDRAEANSAVTRAELWDWFNDTISTRLMSDTGSIILIQCMTGDTPVLMATGLEKPLRDIRPGDEIATYENGKISTSFVRNWANQGPDTIYAIRMKSGITVRANARHPFLVYENGEEKWQQTGSLKKGSVILRAIGASGAVQSAAQTDAIGQRNAKVCACRTTVKADGKTGLGRLPLILPRAVTLGYAAVTALASKSMNKWLPLKKGCAPSASNHLQSKTQDRIGTVSCASIIATTAQKFAGFCATIATSQSDMGKQKKCCCRPPLTYDVTHDTVEEVSECGVEDVYDIQVDRTENFIANGLVSHNTRWHEDDLVGRLTDPTNPLYNKEEAKQWKIINIPAIAEDNDILKRKRGEALWPERFGIEYLEKFRARNPVGFSALYQQRPTPEDGDFFKSEMIVPYKKSQLPSKLRIYAASDHAVGTKQSNDKTCLLVVGVDDTGGIWILDAWWKRERTDRVVTAMINMMKRWKPLIWWAEKGHISSSIGPFLYKRMREESVFVNVREQHPAADKETRAQSIQGRASMGMVHFPVEAPWYENARSELLKFPQGRHDDFVDALSHIGLGLEVIISAAPQETKKVTSARVGTMGWVKETAALERKREAIIANLGGM